MDEHQMYQESAAMRHCVLTYGSRASKGGTRIFSIAKDGKPHATGGDKVRSGRRGMGVIQVRTVRNHDAGRETHAARQNAAKMYTEAWSKSREHRAWEVKHQG